MVVRIMLGILGALGFVATVSGGVIYLNETYASRPAFERLETQFVGYVDNQRLDALERRLDDYRRNGTCQREPQVCRELMADIRRLKRRLGVR